LSTKPTEINYIWLKIKKVRIFLLASLCLLAGRAAFAQDTIPPVIALKGDSIMLLGVYETFEDPGIIVTDNVDTFVTYDTVGNDNSGTFYDFFPDGKADSFPYLFPGPYPLGLYSIVYRAKDKAGNTDSATRYIEVVDTIPPEVGFFTPLECVWQDSLFNYDFFLIDNFRKNSDIKIWIEGCPDNKKTGIYKIRLKASDQSGNVGTTQWHYIIVKKYGDTTACVLTDSLKDTCKRYAGLAKEPIKTELKIYPNPAQNIFYIKLDKYEMTNVRLMDLTGKIHLEIALNNPGIQAIRTDDLANGIYLVEVNGSGGKRFGKIVVRR
jgi:hypothetical protein